jgi:hypothetical protein
MEADCQEKSLKLGGNGKDYISLSADTIKNLSYNSKKKHSGADAMRAIESPQYAYLDPEKPGKLFLQFNVTRNLVCKKNEQPVQTHILGWANPDLLPLLRDGNLYVSLLFSCFC